MPCRYDKGIFGIVPCTDLWKMCALSNRIMAIEDYLPSSGTNALVPVPSPLRTVLSLLPAPKLPSPASSSDYAGPLHCNFLTGKNRRLTLCFYDTKGAASFKKRKSARTSCSRHSRQNYLHTAFTYKPVNRKQSQEWAP